MPAGVDAIVSTLVSIIDQVVLFRVKAVINVVDAVLRHFLMSSLEINFKVDLVIIILDSFKSRVPEKLITEAQNRCE